MDTLVFHGATQHTPQHNTTTRPQHHTETEKEDRDRERREDGRGETRQEKREDLFCIVVVHGFFCWCSDFLVNSVCARDFSLVNSVKYDSSLISFGAPWQVKHICELFVLCSYILQFFFFFLIFLVMQLQFRNFPNYLIMQLQFFCRNEFCISILWKGTTLSCMYSGEVSIFRFCSSSASDSVAMLSAEAEVEVVLGVWKNIG